MFCVVELNQIGVYIFMLFCCLLYLCSKDKKNCYAEEHIKLLFGRRGGSTLLHKARKAARGEERVVSLIRQD